MKFIVMLVFWHRETGLFDILQFDGRLDYTIILIIRLYYYVVIFFFRRICVCRTNLFIGTKGVIYSSEHLWTDEIDSVTFLVYFKM